MSAKDWIEVVSAVVAILAAIYGVIKAWLEIPIILGDFSDRRKRRRYRVLTTTIKALIGEKETELIKLRTIRFHEKSESLELDQIPKVFETERPTDQGRWARVTNLYSLPGTATQTPEKLIRIMLKPDEAFLAGKDHNVVVGYKMNETIEKLWTPPQLVVVPPVGAERLVMEVHFPQGWRFKRDQDNRATKLRVFTRNVDGSQSDLPVKPSDYQHNFEDGRGEVDWLRAVIPNPPEQGNQEVWLEWEWERTIGTLPATNTAPVHA